jgi:hypothetical protein
MLLDATARMLSAPIRAMAGAFDIDLEPEDDDLAMLLGIVQRIPLPKLSGLTRRAFAKLTASGKKMGLRSGFDMRDAIDQVPGAAAEIGELWRSFIEEVQGQGAGSIASWDLEATFREYLPRRSRTPGRTDQDVEDMVRALREYPLRVWPRLGRKGQPIDHSELHELQVRTQERLRLIVSGGNVGSLIRDLRVRPTTRLLLREARTVCGQAVTSQNAVFWLSEDRVDETLESHVDELFMTTAVNRMWSRIVSCAAADCRRFRVMRIRRPGPRYCSDNCRELSNRPRRIAKVSRVKAARRAAIRKRARELLDASGGSGDAWMQACRENGLTSRQAEALLMEEDKSK